MEISGCLLSSLVITHVFICGLVEGRTTVVQHKGQLIKHKHAVKTIKNEDGDIVDCVDIYKQPAFDHPLLKNHKIQMRPTSYPKGMKPATATIGTNHKRPLLKTVQCPTRTIPILRRKLISSQSTSSTLNPDRLSFASTQSEVALAYATQDKYTGVEAYLNVWNPMVEVNEEASGAYLWAQTGEFDSSDLNIAGAGWMVNPSVYGDNRTRLTIFWTKDNFVTTGCYDVTCSGFVQLSSQTILGGALDISRYGDYNHQVDVFLNIFKDKGGGNWWLIVQEELLGYWPSTIFSGMAERAERLFWGSKIINTKKFGRHTLTEMGSGHFPWDGFSRSSFIRNLKLIDDGYALRIPNIVSKIVTNGKCYDLNVGGGPAGDWGIFFYYGGFGGWYDCQNT